ncbi:MAG: urease accessory UreF family protein [Pseudomonadota bacterium]
MDRLSLMQWLSPAFPTGGFAYSHGLEQVVTDGRAGTAAAVQAWLADILRHGAGRSDALMLVAGLNPKADRAALDDLARALAPSAERLRETEAQGTAFAQTVAAVTGRDLRSRPLPLAVAEAASALSLPPAEIAALYLHGFAANLVSVAVRFVPLGQTEGQKILAALHLVIMDIADEAVELARGHDAEALIPLMTSGVLAADLAAMRHETLDVRIYRT